MTPRSSAYLTAWRSSGASGPVPYLASYDLTDLTDPILTLNGNPADALFLANFGIGFYNPLEQQVDKFKFDVSRDIANDSVIKFGRRSVNRMNDFPFDTENKLVSRGQFHILHLRYAHLHLLYPAGQRYVVDYVSPPITT